MIIKVTRGNIHLRVGDREVYVQGEMIPFPPGRDPYFWVFGADRWDDGTVVSAADRSAIDTQLVADAAERGLALDFSADRPDSAAQ